MGNTKISEDMLHEMMFNSRIEKNINRANNELHDSGNTPDERDYKNFLKKRTLSAKRARTYIDSELYQRLKILLVNLRSEISIADYIDNIVSNHLEEYKEPITKLYKNNYKKPV